MKSAKAFSPGNLSCIFVINSHKDPRKKGSLGIGCTTKQGALVTVSKAKKTEVFYNNKKINFPTVVTVIKALTNKNIKVKIKSGLPLGVGFGISGASALATSYALNRLLRLNKTKKHLASMAHMAEVINHTGLGDVGGQFNGLGFMIKKQRGNPLKVTSLNIKNIYLYYKIFGPLHTKKIINKKRFITNINRAGLKALKKVRKNIKLEKIIEISKEFSINSGLLRLADKKIKKLIQNIEKNNGRASMIMLGNAIYSNILFKGCKKIRIMKNEARTI